MAPAKNVRHRYDGPMKNFALQVTGSGDGGWCWAILRATDNPLVFEKHSAGECEWESYQAALDNGAVALAKAQGQAYENEGADPVGAVGDDFPADRDQPEDQERQPL